MLFPWKQLAIWFIHVVLLSNLPFGCNGTEYVSTNVNCKIPEYLTNSDTDNFLHLQYDGNSSQPVSCMWSTFFYRYLDQQTWEAQFIQLGAFSDCSNSNVTISIGSASRKEIGHICSTSRPLLFTGYLGDTLNVEYNAKIPLPWDTFILSFRRLPSLPDDILCNPDVSCVHSTDNHTKYGRVQQDTGRNSQCHCTFSSSLKEEFPLLAFIFMNNTYGMPCSTTYITLFDDHGLNVMFCPGEQSSLIYGVSPVTVRLTHLRNIGVVADMLYRAVSFWSEEQVIESSNADREMQTLTLQPPAGYDRDLNITWYPQQNPYMTDVGDTLTVLNVTYFRSQSDGNKCSDSHLLLSERWSQNEVKVCKTTPHFPLVYKNLHKMTYRTKHSVGTNEFSLTFFRFYQDRQFCSSDSIIFDVGAFNKTFYGVKMTHDSNGMLCRYSLKNPKPGDDVDVTVTYLSLGLAAEECRISYLKFYKDVYDPPVEQHCPGSEPFSYTFRDEYLHIEMATANPLLGTGFSMTFKQHQATFDCSNSPNYVSIGIGDDYSINYPPDTLDTSRDIKCTWIIYSWNDQITLTVPDVIVNQYVCGDAYIQVRDGASVDDPLLGNICSSSLKRVFTSTHHNLRVELFIQARTKLQPKLSLQLNATLGTVCKATTDVSITNSSRISFTVPQFYGSPGTCEWRITNRKSAPVGTIAAVLMKYKLSYEPCDSVTSLVSVRDGASSRLLPWLPGCDSFQSDSSSMIVSLDMGQLQPLYNAKGITMDFTTVVIPCIGNSVSDVSVPQFIHVNVQNSSNLRCTWIFRQANSGSVVVDVSYDATIRRKVNKNCDLNGLNIYDGRLFHTTLIRDNCFGYAGSTSKGEFTVRSSSDTLMLQLFWTEPQNDLSLVFMVSVLSSDDSGSANTAMIVSLVCVSIVSLATIGTCLIYRKYRKKPSSPQEIYGGRTVEETPDRIDEEPVQTQHSEAPPTYEDSQIQMTTFTTDPALPSYKTLFPEAENYF